MTRPAIQMQAYVPYARTTSLADFAASISTGEDHFFGVYVIRSDIKSERYRFGASGVSYSNKGDAGLRSRLDEHAGRTPTLDDIARLKAADRTPHSETRLRSPWTPLWACALSGSSVPITLIAEGILGLCLVENGYEMCTEKGERSMFVVKRKDASLEAVTSQFHCYFTKCAAVLGFDASVPDSPISLPVDGVARQRRQKNRNS
jgi:hypothetical protein